MAEPAFDTLPDHVAKYGETPVFTQDTVPKKLTANHDTKAGVWGRICVLTGQLDYSIPGAPQRSHRIAAGEYGIIRPQELHRVTPIGALTFKVEFYR